LLKNLFGIPTGDVLIVVNWRLSTVIQYLTWFGKPPTFTGEELILLEIDREEITIHMEEEDHFLSRLSLLTHCCTRQQGCCPSQPLLCLFNWVVESDSVSSQAMEDAASL
jgi:hypothetical protein